MKPSFLQTTGCEIQAERDLCFCCLSDLLMSAEFVCVCVCVCGTNISNSVSQHAHVSISAQDVFLSVCDLKSAIQLISEILLGSSPPPLPPPQMCVVLLSAELSFPPGCLVDGGGVGAASPSLLRFQGGRRPQRSVNNSASRQHQASPFHNTHTKTHTWP